MQNSLSALSNLYKARYTPSPVQDFIHVSKEEQNELIRSMLQNI
jgi:hypothetical protein